MARLRRQFSLARIMVAVLILAVNFAWLGRAFWPTGLAFSAGLLVPLFISGLALTDVIAIVAIGLVVGALLLPSAVPDHSRRRRAGLPPTATAPGPGPAPTPNRPTSAQGGPRP